MSECYVIIYDKMNLDEVVRQVRAIKTFPAVVRLYDRIFTIDTVEGIFGLLQGIEVGWFLAQERHEQDLQHKRLA